VKCAYVVFQFLAALAALAAGIAWYRASKKPVAKPGPMGYMPEDQNHPVWQEMRAIAVEIERGVELNRRAAALTAAAAAIQFLALLIGALKDAHS
jgi:hypothetical protein